MIRQVLTKLVEHSGNLSEVIIRSTDTFADLQRKARLATILGTLQATLTDFRYLSKEWKKNTEEEALLGVSLTGIMDHPVMNGSTTYVDPFLGLDVIALDGWPALPLGNILLNLKETVISTNEEYANKLGINMATATTCVNV